MTNPFRHLPAVNDVLDTAVVRDLGGQHARPQVVAAIRAELDALRKMDVDTLVEKRLAKVQAYGQFAG